MENRAYALATGLFVLLMGLALAATVAWFQGDSVARVGYTVVSRSGVPGLNLKAPVKLRGVEVGKVQAIAFDPADARQILVTVMIDETAPISTGTYAQLALQGVTGLSFISLEDAAGGPYPHAAEGARIELRPSLLDRLAEGGPGLLAGFAETANRLNALLSDGNRARIGQSIEQLGSAAAEATRLMAALQPTAQALPRLLAGADAAVQRSAGTLAQIEALVADSRSLAQELRARAAALDRIAPAAQQLEATARSLELALVGTAAPRTRPLLDDFAAATRAVERAANDLDAQPQSLLFGRPGAPPGPGEAGFDERLKAAR